MSMKHVSFFTKLNKNKSIWCCIALFLLLVISSCATNEVSGHLKSNIVLNHIILTVDQPTFTSIMKSEFIKDTFSAIKISSPQSGRSDSWSRAYIYGQNTYIELFSRDNLKSEDFSGVGFGVDAAGDLDTLLYSIPDSLSDDFTKQTMYKNTDKGKQPWFYFITSTTAYTDYKLRIFVMEYDYDFIKSRFLDIDPEAINITRKLYNHQQYRDDLLLKDIIEFDLALNDFDRAIRMDPENARPYNSRGIIYKNLGRPQKAIANFSKAVRLDPSYAEAYINRGIGHISMGEYDRACEDFRKACDNGDCAYLEWARKNGDCQ